MSDRKFDRKLGLPSAGVESFFADLVVRNNKSFLSNICFVIFLVILLISARFELVYKKILDFRKQIKYNR